MALERLAVEFKGLARALDSATFARYLGLAAMHAPQILRTRKLVAADRGMHGITHFKTWREDVLVDCDFVDSTVRSFDETLVFTLARELYCRNVYFRAYEPFRAEGQTVVDLGANRGLFSALAAAAVAPARIVAVEPLAGYLPVLKRLTERFAVKVQPVTAFVGNGVGTGYGEFRNDLGVPAVTMSSLLAPEERIAFMKIDIEGGEEALFRGATEWLGRTDRIAMEAHQGYCDTGFVYRTLQDAGFTVFPSNDIGQRVGHLEAEFYYCARNPDHFAAGFRPPA